MINPPPFPPFLRRLSLYSSDTSPVTDHLYYAMGKETDGTLQRCGAGWLSSEQSWSCCQNTASSILSHCNFSVGEVAHCDSRHATLLLWRMKSISISHLQELWGQFSKGYGKGYVALLARGRASHEGGTRVAKVMERVQGCICGVWSGWGGRRTTLRADHEETLGCFVRCFLA